MQILSHRGYWKDSEEKNLPIAFERSFSLGFGTETDVRDYQGDLVVSHDIATKDSLLFTEFLSLYKKYDTSLPLALNVKADGLQQKLKATLVGFDIQQYFMFDMSVPDGLGYLKENLTTFTRQSEYETSPAFYDKAQGVWLDEFHHHWITKDIIQHHLNAHKKICIVSPDLHKRDYLDEWGDYKEMVAKLTYNPDDIMLCTDFPEQAKAFFCE